MQEAVELADARELPRRRAARHALGFELGKIGLDMFGAAVLQADAGRAKECAIGVEIAAIGGKRVGSRTTFRRQHLEKARSKAATACTFTSGGVFHAAAP